LTIFVLIFIAVRSLKDKKETMRKKFLNLSLLFLIFASVLTYFMTGPYLVKKDIEQNTIYCYEGSFEIIEISHGIYSKATFRFENQEITLKYSTDDMIELGKYEGKLIYAQHLAQVVDLEIFYPQIE
jgi:hypothetical protein